MELSHYLIIAPPLLLALTFHEFSHAYVANRLGDPTAQLMGRLTMNPLVHLDLLGTAMLFIAHFGWAKPVPVNPINFKNPKRDLLWVSLAGPASNLFLAFLFGIGMRMIGISQIFGKMDAIITMLWFGLYINIILAFFNLLPIPPLDGSKILMGIVPEKYEYQLEPLLKYGPTILIGLIIISMISKVNILGIIINPFVKFFAFLFAGIKL